MGGWVGEKFNDATSAMMKDPGMIIGMPGIGPAVEQAKNYLPQEPDPLDPNKLMEGDYDWYQRYLNTATRNSQVDQMTPYGSSTWTTGPNGQRVQTVALSPQQQALEDSRMMNSMGMATASNNMLDRVQQQYSTPLNYDNAPQVYRGQYQTNVPTSNFQTRIDPYGQIQNNVAGAGDIQRQVDLSGINPLSYSAQAGPLQNQIDMSGVPSLVGGADLTEFQNKARDAAWNNQQAMLDPKWSNYSKDLETKLVNQGVMQNSEAWNKAMAEMSRERGFDYAQAQNNAVNQGLTAAQQLFGQGLASNQNAFGQATGRGQFANQTQGQGFGQNLSNAQLGNQSSMNMADARFRAQAALNAAQGQQYGQNVQGMALGNAAQAQGFGQNALQGTFGNQAQNDLFAQNMGNANLNNAAQGQQYNESMGARNQAINEANTLYQNPMNIFNALRGGAQVTNPTFQQNPVIQSQYNNGYSNAAQQAQAQKLGSYNSAMSGIGNLFGAGLMAFGGPLGAAAGAGLPAMWDYSGGATGVPGGF